MCQIYHTVDMNIEQQVNVREKTKLWMRVRGNEVKIGAFSFMDRPLNKNPVIYYPAVNLLAHLPLARN